MIHPVIELCMETPGAFHLVKISGISRSAVNGTRLRRFVPLENSQKKWKILKGEPVFPVGISERNFVFHLHVSRSLYQFQVHGRAPQRTGVYDQMEQLFANRKFHFCCHQNFPFFPKWKAPAIFMPMRMRTPSGTAGNQEKHPLLSFATKA